MKKMSTDENILFSKNIVELKLIADRISEGRGMESELFTNLHQVLYILDRKEVVNPREIISELNIAKSNLAILAKKMIEDGLIESHKDQINRREIYYNITQAGRDVLYSRLALIDNYYGNEAKNLSCLLAKVIDELKKLEAKKYSKKRKTNTK